MILISSEGWSGKLKKMAWDTGGSTISELQEQTGARIKLSQNNDFYPGM